MKKGITILALILAVTVSCKKSTDLPKSKNALIVGAWKPLKYIKECNGEQIELSVPTACESNTRKTYNANGTGVLLNFFTDNAGNCISETNNFNWSINNDILTEDFNGNSIIYNHLVINNSTLDAGNAYSDSTCDYKDYSVFERVN